MRPIRARRPSPTVLTLCHVADARDQFCVGISLTLQTVECEPREPNPVLCNDDFQRIHSNCSPLPFAKGSNLLEGLTYWLTTHGAILSDVVCNGPLSGHHTLLALCHVADARDQFCVGISLTR